MKQKLCIQLLKAPNFPAKTRWKCLESTKKSQVSTQNPMIFAAKTCQRPCFNRRIHPFFAANLGLKARHLGFGLSFDRRGRSRHLVRSSLRWHRKFLEFPMNGGSMCIYIYMYIIRLIEILDLPITDGGSLSSSLFVNVYQKGTSKSPEKDC